jgi:hypothetical protein
MRGSGALVQPSRWLQALDGEFGGFIWRDPRRILRVCPHCLCRILLCGFNSRSAASFIVARLGPSMYCSGHQHCVLLWLLCRGCTALPTSSTSLQQCPIRPSAADSLQALVATWQCDRCPGKQQQAWGQP